MLGFLPLGGGALADLPVVVSGSTHTLTITSTSLAQTNSSTNLVYKRQVVVTTLPYALTESNVGIAKGAIGIIGTRSYSLSLSPTSLSKGKSIQISTSSFSLDNSSISIISNRVFELLSQPYVIIANDVVFIGSEPPLSLITLLQLGDSSLQLLSSSPYIYQTITSNTQMVLDSNPLSLIGK